MIVIPAIDLKDGRCVRLAQGRMDQEAIYSEDPVGMAKHWESRGAKRLHIVDLNGAVVGRPVHQAEIAAITRAVRIPVEVGGGIREVGTIEDYLSLGVSWVILGTAAFKNHELVKEACSRFPGRIILSMDAKRGDIALRGWCEIVPVKAMELLKQLEGMGFSAIVFTDVERDGMGTGVNLEMTRELARVTSIPVIASGGISRVEEIGHLKELEPEGIVGVIIGRALYTGQVQLEEAIRISELQ